MNKMQKRFLGFLGGCVPVRLLFVVIAYHISTDYLPIMGGLAILPVLGWLSIYFLGLRKSGLETQGQPIWWNTLRPVHALLYGIFIYLAFNQSKEAWIPLLVDVMMGLTAFLIYHGVERNYSKIISI